MSTITSPSVWFSLSQPTSGRTNALFIWEESATYLQMAVGINIPSPNPYAPNVVLVKLTSEENNLADADLYNHVVRNVVAAYKTNSLRLEYTTTPNEELPVIPANIATVATSDLPAILVRVMYIVDSNDVLKASITVTDSHGFVLARNIVTVLENFSTSPSVVENLDLVTLPLSTQSINTQGNFGTSTLLPVKNLSLSSYKALPGMWYGDISTLVPPSINMRQVALWRHNGKLQIAIALPLDELLTKPTTTLVRGIVSDLATTQLCTTKWWYLVNITPSTDNKTAALVSKVLTAANQGLLFISGFTSVNINSDINAAYHPVPNSLTVSVGLRYGTRSSNSIGEYYDQQLALRIMDGDDDLVSTADVRVRMSCGSTDLIFPSDGVFISLPCSQGNCGNPASMERLSAHGSNIGINVLQGRGGIPTGTSITEGERASYWDLTRYVLANLNSFLFLQNSYAVITDAPARVYIPYMGRLTSVHSNHPARAAVLGYTHYYYPDVFQPLDIGHIATFGTVITGANYAMWTSADTAIVSDDDQIFAVAEALKNKAVFLCIPNYPSSGSVTAQLQTKEVKLFFPGNDSPYQSVNAEADTALTMDLSKLRVPTPVFNMEYDTPIVEYFAQATYRDKRLSFISENALQCGANLFIGFSGKATVNSWSVRHTLSLPSVLGTTKAFTGFTNYPEYAVPFTIGSPAFIGGGPPVTAPLSPTFTGRLPPNYRMVWVDWTSITPASITVRYWAGEASYDLTTVYNGFTGSNIVTVALPVMPGADTAVVTDGSVLLRVEVEKHNNELAILRIYAGSTLVAESAGTSTMVPWVHAGSIYLHAHGNNNGIDDVEFGNIGGGEGIFSPSTALDTTSSDYVELAIEQITTSITSANYANMDLKPYRMYWDSTEKALYIPVLGLTSSVPIRLAKCLAFSSSAGTPASITELLTLNTPVQRILLAAKHGLANLPTGTHHAFTSNDINTGDSAIEFYWRKGANYATVVGPLPATIVNGVTVPTRVHTVGTGEDVNAQTYLKTIPAANYSNVDVLSDGVVIKSVLNSTAYFKVPMWFKSDVQKYTVHFSRKAQGIWQTTALDISHLAVYIFPTRLSEVGIPTLPLAERLQSKAIRMLIPRDTGTVQVQTSLYRGYAWDQGGVSSGINLANQGSADTSVAYSLSGTGVLTSGDNNAVIAMTLFNAAGMLGFTLYENQTAKLSGTIPVPYFNNGTVAFALQNAGNQASEYINNIHISAGDRLDFTTVTNGGQTQLVASGQQSTTNVYCVPTTTISRDLRVTSDTSSVIQVPSTAKYGYLDYVITNNGLVPANVELHISSQTVGTNSIIYTGTLQPNTSHRETLLYIHRGESLHAVVNGSGTIDINSTILVQL